MIENLKVDGSFDQLNVLQELHIDFIRWGFFKKFAKIFLKFQRELKNLVMSNIRPNIEGSLDEFEMSNSDNFIGSIAASNFVN